MAATSNDLLSERLRNQHLTRPDRQKPAQVVASLGAMQAQDFPAAKWAVGLRAPGCQQPGHRGGVQRRRDPAHARAAADVALRRAPQDIRWMVGLERASRARHQRVLLSAVGTRREDVRARLRDDASRARGRRADDARGAGGGVETREGAGRRVEARLHHDARGTGRRDLQRTAARQTIHLRAARSTRAGQQDARSPGRGGRTGQAILHQSRAGDDPRFRVVVRVDGQGSGARHRGGEAETAAGDDRRAHALARDRRAPRRQPRAARRCCCRITTNT